MTVTSSHERQFRYRVGKLIFKWFLYRRHWSKCCIISEPIYYVHWFI